MVNQQFCMALKNFLGPEYPLSKLFQGQETMLNFLENVDPHSCIGEIFRVQIRDWEAWNPPEDKFDRILCILKILWFFDKPLYSLKKA